MADIRELIKVEYLKCAEAASFFMKKHVYIQHPQRGRILFNLYPFQEEVLQAFQENQNIIVLKSRQLGISTLASSYALWLMLFHKDKNILCLATTQSTARNLVSKVIFAYEQLPVWLKVPYRQKNKLSLWLSNGSKITAKSSNTESARSEAVSLLIMDEAAFIENAEETFTAAQQTVATGGQVFLLSTPNGIGNFFHRMWVKAETGENSFLPIKLPWNVHPERDQVWRDKQTADMGVRAANQELECNFLTSGDTAFEQEDMAFYEQTYVMEPVERRGIDGNFWIWEYPDYTKSYLISADVARGDGSDYSAFHVWDIKACTQVAEYKGQLSPKDYGAMMCGIATEYNKALLSVENASIGWSTIEEIQARGYENLYYSSTAFSDTAESYMRKAETSKLVPGFTMSMKTRPLAIAKMYDFVHQKDVVIHSKRLLTEMRTFIWKNGKAQAAVGLHDDLVMSAAQGLYIRDTALKLRQQGLDLTRAALTSFANLNKRGSQAIATNYASNPFEIRTPQGDVENISWVLK